MKREIVDEPEIDAFARERGSPNNEGHTPMENQNRFIGSEARN